MGKPHKQTVPIEFMFQVTHDTATFLALTVFQSEDVWLQDSTYSRSSYNNCDFPGFGETERAAVAVMVHIKGFSENYGIESVSDYETNKQRLG